MAPSPAAHRRMCNSRIQKSLGSLQANPRTIGAGGGSTRPLATNPSKPGAVPGPSPTPFTWCTRPKG